MGLDGLPNSGNRFTGSRMIVPGLGLSTYKVQKNDKLSIRKNLYAGSIPPTVTPTPEPTVSVYSQVLDFFSTPQYNSIKYRCDGIQVQACYSPGGYNNITDVVALFNSPPTTSPGCLDPSFCYCWTNYGTYYDNGDGRIRCEMPISTYNTLCLGGILTLDVIND